MLINIHSLLIVSHHRQLALLWRPKITTDKDTRTHAGALLAAV